MTPDNKFLFFPRPTMFFLPSRRPMSIVPVAELPLFAYLKRRFDWIGSDSRSESDWGLGLVWRGSFQIRQPWRHFWSCPGDGCSVPVTRSQTVSPYGGDAVFIEDGDRGSLWGWLDFAMFSLLRMGQARCNIGEPLVEGFAMVGGEANNFFFLQLVLFMLD